MARTVITHGESGYEMNGQPVRDKPKCEWCWEREATGDHSVSAPGSMGGLRPVHTCDKCEPRRIRFMSALSYGKVQANCLDGTDWLPNGRPDLVITREGQKPATIKNYGQLGAKERKGLFPKARKRKAALSPIEDIAKRKAKLERERSKLERDVRELVAAKAAPVTAIAKALGVSRQRVYQLASA